MHTIRSYLLAAIGTVLSAVGSGAADGYDDKLNEALSLVNGAVAEAELTSGLGEPAMWTVSDEDTTIYLYGTVHILRPETEWRSPAFEAAFASADKLVVEVDALSVQGGQLIQRALPRYGVFSDGTSLANYVDAEEAQIINRALGTVGASIEAMGPAKPWLVNLQLSLAMIQASGFDPNSGLERILTSEAQAAGKSLGFLETVDEQFSALAGGPLEVQVDQLVFTAASLENGAAVLDSLVDEWVDGDTVGLGRLVAEPELFGGEETYEALLVNRNRNWIPKITAMLDEPGAIFIAVGAAHLAGPDSVVEMLRAEGLSVTGP